MPKLKDIKTQTIDGEEKIWYWPTGEKAKHFSAKHTYLKCNACGKKFSLNYSDKNFEKSKIEALKKKWEHQETEHHHQEEILYFGEEAVEEGSS